MDILDFPLLQGISREEANRLMECLKVRQQSYARGDTLLRAGEITKAMGLVLEGSVNIRHDDAWGNQSILGHVETGGIFAETYATAPETPLLVSVIAAEPCRILFLTLSQLLALCPRCCEAHQRLIRNLLALTAQKNLALSRRMAYTSAKTIRGRLLSYLSDQARQQESRQFAIPFNRQQLAEYLSVDRSALSNELSKMRREGLITFRQNQFFLLNGQEL